MTRMFNEDAYCIGLLYTYFFSKQKKSMVLFDDLKLFHEEIEKNLEIIGSNDIDMYKTVWYDDEDDIYFKSYNKDDELYYILKPDFNFSKAKDRYIKTMSDDCLMASLMSNALECLGIETITNKNSKNNVIKKNRNKQK